MDKYYVLCKDFNFIEKNSSTLYGLFLIIRIVQMNAWFDFLLNTEVVSNCADGILVNTVGDMGESLHIMTCVVYECDQWYGCIPSIMHVVWEGHKIWNDEIQIWNK